jgi:inhibitor of KinA sporulation pathway (predicted exonuclease)
MNKQLHCGINLIKQLTLELDELIKHRNIINYVKTQRLSWFGHINRMPETGIVKKIHKWKPFTGRPKSRWEDDVRNDLKKMKLIIWTEQSQDRLKWKGTAEKAKTVPEL